MKTYITVPCPKNCGRTVDVLAEVKSISVYSDSFLEVDLGKTRITHVCPKEHIVEAERAVKENMLKTMEDVVTRSPQVVQDASHYSFGPQDKVVIPFATVNEMREAGRNRNFPDGITGHCGTCGSEVLSQEWGAHDCDKDGS